MRSRKREAQRGWTGHRASEQAPAGGGGPGSSRRAGVLGIHAVPFTTIPARTLDVDRCSEASRLRLQERAEAVYQAITLATNYVPRAIVDATGQELHGIVAGIVPGLLIFIAVLALSTALGAAAGAALGAFVCGVGTAPGAAAGAGLGFRGGIGLLDYLGLAFLVKYVGESLVEATSVATSAVRSAWRSVDNNSTQPALLDKAARDLALAVALVFRGVLQGVVAFLLAKGTAAAARRVPELVRRFRASKLGAGFAEWIERNWKGLIEEPKLKPHKTLERGGSSGKGAKESISGARKAQGSARRSQSYEDIDAYRKTYERKEIAARNAGQDRRATGYQTKVTEAIGERATTKYMETNHPDFVMDKGFNGPGHGFDQVYTKYDAAGNPVEILIVEAKGPSAKLATNAAKGRQMSKEWVKNTISEMVKSEDSTTKALGKRLRTALDDGEPPVTGKVIEALKKSGAKEVPLPPGPEYNGGRYN